MPSCLVVVDMRTETDILPTIRLETTDYRFTLNKKGADLYTKVSFPVKYGVYSEIETEDSIFQFNLNKEIRQARLKTSEWINPQEWLKRTVANDWVYYSTGGYTGVFESIGEYYLPNLMYETNSLIGGKPFAQAPIRNLSTSWYSTLSGLLANSSCKKDHFTDWKKAVLNNPPEFLENKANGLFEILGRRVTVLPPDARHVDYDVIPLNICDGCLYKCNFCRVKSPEPFSVRSEKNIEDQIEALKAFYADDILNYNSLFLGEHDALNAPGDLIIFAAKKALDGFDFKKSFMKDNFLFMFGSVDSFLDKNEEFFGELNRLDYLTYINIGMESADQKTLDRLGKPITTDKVKKAFEKVQTVNRKMNNIEITCNFVMGENLSQNHYASFLELARDGFDRPRSKGTLYLSPLEFAKPSKEKVFDFNRIKTLSRVPTFLYIIQRL
jgi:hypothetical protein